MNDNETNRDKSVRGESGDLLSGDEPEWEIDGEDDPDSEIGVSGSDDAGAGCEVLGESASAEAVQSQKLPGVNPTSLEPDAVKFEYRCKICQLAVRVPTLYRHIHELVLKDKMSYTKTLSEANNYIKQHRLGIPLFNMVNITGHFKKHISYKQQIALAVARINPPQQPVPAAAQDVAPLAIQAAKTETDDFKNLDNLRGRLIGIADKLERQLETRDQSDGQLKLDRWNVQLYVTLISEARSCINDLNKMRQSERLMNTVVQQLLDRMTFAIIPQLLEEYKIVVDELRHEGVEQKIIDMVDLRLRQKSAQIIAQTARAAVLEIQREFKLR